MDSATTDTSRHTVPGSELISPLIMGSNPRRAGETTHYPHKHPLCQHKERPLTNEDASLCITGWCSTIFGLDATSPSPSKVDAFYAPVYVLLGGEGLALQLTVPGLKSVFRWVHEPEVVTGVRTQKWKRDALGECKAVLLKYPGQHQRLERWVSHQYCWNKGRMYTLRQTWIQVGPDVLRALICTEIDDDGRPRQFRQRPRMVRELTSSSEGTGYDGSHPFDHESEQ
ncbi:hypothetical protein LQW54_006239 [Pestalotiopsis sp. IQ-011]